MAITEAIAAIFFQSGFVFESSKRIPESVMSACSTMQRMPLSSFSDSRHSRYPLFNRLAIMWGSAQSGRGVKSRGAGRS